MFCLQRAILAANGVQLRGASLFVDTQLAAASGAIDAAAELAARDVLQTEVSTLVDTSTRRASCSKSNARCHHRNGPAPLSHKLSPWLRPIPAGQQQTLGPVGRTLSRLSMRFRHETVDVA